MSEIESVSDEELTRIAKGMEEKKTERMTVPATDAEKTGQEVKKPVKVAKKEERSSLNLAGARF